MRDLDKLCALLGVDEIRVVHEHAGWNVALRLGTQWLSTHIDLRDLVGVKNQEVEIGRTVSALAAVLKNGKRGELDALGGVSKPPHPPITGRGFQPGCMCIDCLERETESELRRPISRFEAVAEEMKKL